MTAAGYAPAYEKSARRAWTRGVSWEAVGLLGVFIVAAALRLWNLTQNGFSNNYYSTVAQSMAGSWHNFLYASFDPLGILSSEKPPMAQAALVAGVKLLGFHPLGILLPHALLGLASIALVYLTVRQALGVGPALVSALALAVTPIGVAMDRHNNPDAMMVFLLTASAWALMRSIAQARLGWLAASMALGGLAFNAKMLQALVPLPAFLAAYLFCAAAPWSRRIWHTAVAAAVLALMAGSWPLLFDLTPPSGRPYAGGSRDGTMRDLILGYNGLSRVRGGDGMQLPAGAPSGAMPGGMGSAFSSGKPGFNRFAEPRLASQAMWLLPLGLIGGLLALYRRQWLAGVVAFGGWAVLSWAVLSFSKGMIHSYYTVMFGPALAVLAGIAARALWLESAAGGWRRTIPVLAFVLTAAWQVYLVRSGWTDGWLPSACGMLLIAGLAAMFELKAESRPMTAGFAVALVSLLILPAAWSLPAVQEKTAGPLPEAGPKSANDPIGGMMDRTESANPELIRYLLGHRNGEPVLAATPSAIVASSMTVASGAPVLSMSGFVGMDNALSLDRLMGLIKTRQLRYVLGSMMDSSASGAARAQWMSANCQIVPNREWSGGQTAMFVLYDCKQE